VHQGQVQLYGEDGQQWSYRYAADGVTQLGTNGWDGSNPAPGSTEQDTGTATPAFTYPGQSSRPAPPQPPPEPPSARPSSPSPPPAQRPPGAPGPLASPDEPPPASPARRLAMAALLVIGVLLIVGLALVASGL